MNDRSPPVLGAKSIIAIRREGGLAAFPGLMTLRRIHCDECTEQQRRWLQALLSQAVRACDDSPPPGADRRVFSVDIQECGDDKAVDADARRVWSLSIPEEQMPEALRSLWEHGMSGDENAQ
ncbi:hypothetical protein SAMN02745148_00077 [Modicisalibacter ilicicola DSM 19980]|uniref:Uncharacterized protein n=1 Tax=Modicisalibacter ilicicola DSM 19980 TaxID=1121942 RepID=A0A1M4SDF4_9GAMM|nr:protealysin inhibitor emfourin [Halomonas ilicicola]SHE30240.1 hypothetical protein SAMN02745148_00077 [Halomonas ilicicola DSM 19980]